MARDTLLSHVRLELVERIQEQHAERVKELLRLCFGVAEWSDERRRQHADRFCSRADTWRHVLAFSDADAVVGFATVYRRRIEFNGASIVLGGLGDVCTDPAWRHQGIASAVSAAAVEEMKRASCDVAYLCAAVNNPASCGCTGNLVSFLCEDRIHSSADQGGCMRTTTR